MTKVLLVGEATWQSTGYANYGSQLLTRLQKMGYEVAELASFGNSHDLGAKLCLWKNYTIDPNKNNPEEVEAYSLCEGAHIGKWKFEYALLDFKPNVVISFRDPWIDRFIKDSVLRNFFKWVYMPTCDAIPLDAEWVATMANADVCLTYSDWALGVLSKFKHINLYKSAPPAAEPNIFRKMDKKESKNNLKLPEENFYVGTVMRNQPRKLFPNLFSSFREISKKNSRIKLLCHTSYPDVGWDLPKLLIEYEVENSVYFIRKCDTCDSVFGSLWQEHNTICPNCNASNISFPSTNNGLQRSQLAEIYSCMDLYVQYSVCEGFGMPQIEAAYCGVPIVAVDYSAMASIVETLEGIKIQPKAFYKESETARQLAIPDDGQFAKEVLGFFEKPVGIRVYKSEKTESLAKDNFNYDKTAKVWDEAIKTSLQKDSLDWTTPERQMLFPDHSIVNSPRSVFCEAVLDNEFIGLSEKEKLDLHKRLAGKMLDKNSSGLLHPISNRFESYDQEKAYLSLLNRFDKVRFWERKRAQSI